MVAGSGSVRAVLRIQDDRRIARSNGLKILVTILESMMKRKEKIIKEKILRDQL